MPIDVTCPKCNLILPAPDEFAGKRIRCADCNTIVDVPAPGASTVDLKPAPNFDRPPRRFLNDDDQRPRRREEPERASMTIPLIFAGVLAGSIAIAGAAFFVLGERKVEPPVEPIPAPRPIPIDPPKPAPPLPPFKPTVPEKKTPPKFPASPVGPSSIAGLRFHLPLDSKVGTATLDLHAAKYAGKIAETVEIVAGKRGKAFQFPLAGRAATSTVPVAGLDLNDARDKFTVEANAAITYCLWANTADLARNSTQIFTLGQDRPIDRPRLYISTSRAAGLAYGAFDTTDTGGASFSHAADSTWHHFALRRSTAGVWTCFVDGTAHELRRKAAGAGPKLTFTKVAIGGSVSTTVAGLKPIVAIDDVCVYGRELTDAEVARLAGKD